VRRLAATLQFHLCGLAATQPEHARAMRMHVPEQQKKQERYEEQP
jgi:hypothetical protein